MERAYPKVSERQLMVWGTGFAAKFISCVLDFEKKEYVHFIDSNAQKQGLFFCGKQIIAPREIENKKGSCFIIVASQYDVEISRQLSELGYSDADYFLIPTEEKIYVQDAENILRYEWEVEEAIEREQLESTMLFKLFDRYPKQDISVLITSPANKSVLGERYTNDGKWTRALNFWQQEARIRILRKIEDGVYKSEDIRCLCDANDFQVLSQKDFDALPAVFCICKKCGLIMQNPRLTQDSLDSFYAKEFAELIINYPVLSPEEHYFWRKKDGTEIIYNCVKDFLQDGFRILEIGCGSGSVPGFFREKGYEVVGIDLDEKYIAYGQSIGLELYCGHSDILLEKYEKEFDLIIISHVLEHFTDIEKELAVIKRLLRDGGYLYVEVPGMKGFALDYYGFDFLNSLTLQHSYYFNMNTLKQVMTWFGFSCITADEYVSAVFKHNPLCEKTYHNYYYDIMAYLLFLEENHVKLTRENL